MPTEDNKRIAKNTIFLYFRMGIIMLVKLYTSRVLLNVLGLDDYGVWNAVAAFVIAFSFISSPLLTATQRFLNYDMGKGGKQLNSLFVTSLLLFIIISLIIILALETIGVWFLNNKMNFAQEKIGVVNILFQMSIFSLAVKLLRMPYESTIIAEERMSFYAIICIIESFLMLGIAFFIKIKFDYNKLVLYGILDLVSNVIIAISYKIYCNHKFQYTYIRNVKFDKSLIKEVASFSGWNLFGSCASMSATQGISTLINIFFGVTVNAAYGVATQIQAAVRNIISNFQKASNPQIVKSYSEENLSRTRSLVINVCKYSFLLSLILAIPIIFNIDFILNLWLGKNVPPMANIFSIWILIYTLLMCFSSPMDTAILSSGKIKSFQITYSTIIFCDILFTYIFFRFGAQAYWAIVVKCFVEIGIIIARIIFLRIKIQLKVSEILLSTFIPCAIIAFLSIISVYCLCKYSSLKGWSQLSLSFIIFLITFIPLTWFIALNRQQRNQIHIFIMKRTHSIKHS